jgi:hypothetical protein
MVWLLMIASFQSGNEALLVDMSPLLLREKAEMSAWLDSSYVCNSIQVGKGPVLTHGLLNTLRISRISHRLASDFSRSDVDTQENQHRCLDTISSIHVLGNERNPGRCLGDMAFVTDRWAINPVASGVTSQAILHAALDCTSSW